MGSADDTRRKWERLVADAIDLEGWGQVEEAAEVYQKLSQSIQQETQANSLELSGSRQANLGRLAKCLELRIKTLHGPKTPGPEVSLAEVKKLKTFLKDFLVRDVDFPPELAAKCPPGDATAKAQISTVASKGGATPQMSESGSLLPAPASAAKGDMLLTITVEKWGFKDASGFVDPYVTVSVVDKAGVLLESAQDVPVSKSRENKYITFGTKIHIQTPINRLKHGEAIFFEFKHYKARKRKISTKAYCYLELDELKTGPKALEIYKKPTDFTRKKKHKLLSVKPLYLHLALQCDNV